MYIHLCGVFSTIPFGMTVETLTKDCQYHKDNDPQEILGPRWRPQKTLGGSLSWKDPPSFTSQEDTATQEDQQLKSCQPSGSSEFSVSSFSSTVPVDDKHLKTLGFKKDAYNIFSHTQNQSGENYFTVLQKFKRLWNYITLFFLSYSTSFKIYIIWKVTILVKITKAQS